MISGRQCKAVRNWIGWSQTELGATAGLYRQKVIEFEKGNGIDTSSLAQIEAAFTNEGIRIQKNGSIVLEP